MANLPQRAPTSRSERSGRAAASRVARDRRAALPPRLVGIALAAAGVVACGQWDDAQRAHDVARDLLECIDVTVERTEAHRFHASGCDRHADIVCSEGALDPVCIRVRERGALAARDEEHHADHDAASGETGDRPVALTADGGSIEEVLPDPLADDEAPGDDVGAVRTSGGELSAAEAAIRRGLDARADDVMACVDRDRVAVRVTHHTDGTLRVALTGDLAGTPEEGCVRAALGEVRAPAGASGVVLHLVRRAAPPPEHVEAEPALTGDRPGEPASAPDAGPGAAPEAPATL